MAEPGSTETVREMSQDGADITTPIAMPAGGWGIRGWLSALYTFKLRHKLHVHLDVQALAAVKAYMLIDLSDTTNWPHSTANHIVLERLNAHIDPSVAFRGDIDIGFLSSVDGDNGDLNKVVTFHFGQGALHEDLIRNYESGICLSTDYWFGPVSANDALFQTDLNLFGPDGATAYPSGDGDLVMKVGRTAGDIDIGLSLIYRVRD